MLRPKRMARVLVSGSQDHLADVVEILHDARAVDIISHEAVDDADVQIGDPMAPADELSEHLVVLRSARAALDLDEADVPAETYSADRIEEEIEARLFDLKTNINSLEDDEAGIRDVLRDLEAEIEELEPFEDLPLRLDQYRGYDSLEVLLGTLEGDAGEVLDELDVDGGVFAGEQVQAVFCPTGDADEVRSELSARGWTSVEVPEGEGSVQDRLTELREQRDRFRAKLEEIEDRFDRLRTEHGAFILAAEEHLAIEVEKAEAPLGFAATDNAFVLEGWIPLDELDELQDRLDEAFEADIYVETLETDTHHVEHEPDHEAHDEPEGKPPTELENEGASKPFEFVTNLMSRPRYDEIDPTVLLLVFFPLLFGLMIGDVGYGIAVIGLGVYLRDNDIFGIGGRSIGNVLVACGIATIGFGFVMFQEMFGLHFFYPPAEVKEIHHLVEAGHAHFSQGQLVTDEVFIPPTWSGMILGAEEALHLSEGIAYGPAWLRMPLVKLKALQELMQISIWMALIHMTLGFGIGFVNEKDHLGAAKAFAGQAGWTLVMWGWFLAIVVAMLGPALGLTYLPLDWFPALINLGGVDPHAISLGLTLVGVGAIGLAAVEPEGIVELFGVLSNLVSYARLAAIGISKAGFIFVFNVIAFQTLGGGILAIPILVVAHVIVFALGLISSGVQTLRLNFYEFFSKFFEGGGRPYQPFGSKRKYTET